MKEGKAFHISQKEVLNAYKAVKANKGAGATRKNVEALVSQNKKVKIYELRGVETDKLDTWIKELD